MKVQILDDNVFNSIDPTLAEMYLQANGWKEQHRLESDVSIWFSDYYEDKVFRLWLPFRTSLPDYGQIMGRAIRVIAEAENKSELQVFDDLNTVAVGDVTRLTTYDPLNRESGTLPFDEGEDLIQQGRSLMVAAAMSVKEPKPVYSPARTVAVREFEDSLRLAQTERGSYTIKIISPINLDDLKVKKPENQEELMKVPPTPFSRKATERLIKSLEVLLSIGEEANKKGTYFFQPFNENVQYGISANLLEAVTSKSENAQDRPIRVSVTWSSVIPKPEDTSAAAEVAIPEAFMGYFRAAAQDFRRYNPEALRISGYVKVLSKEHRETEGSVSVVTTVNRNPATVRVALSGEEYKTAVHAHEEDLFISVEGDLIKKGRYFWLENPKNVQIAETPELPLDF